MNDDNYAVNCEKENSPLVAIKAHMKLRRCMLSVLFNVFLQLHCSEQTIL